MKEYEVRSSELWDETRFTIEGETGLTMEGPMALYGRPSRLLSELDLVGQSRGQLARFNKRTFREVIEPGAFRKSLSELPDIVLHYQHDERTLPLGRTTAGTLTLTEAATSVRAKADLPDSTWGHDVAASVKRGDIGGISFRMGHVLDKWASEKLDDGYDGPVRHLLEVQLRREVSLVTFPGYDTPASVRELAEQADLEPDKLAEAFNLLRDPEAKLTDEQHQLLQAAIASKVDAPFLDPKLASMRERLLALAG